MTMKKLSMDIPHGQLDENVSVVAIDHDSPL
jgi:hypothetical protein